MLTEAEKLALRKEIKGNAHEIFVVSMDEMEAVIQSSPASSDPQFQLDWQEFRTKVELGASYTATALDLVTLSKLIGDLGAIGARAYVKVYGGKPHIILKGYPGLRKVLTGTKYGISNPKVVSMGLGKVGAIKAAKTGGIVSIVLLSAYRIADYVLTDEATLSQLIGSLATDVVKVGISTGASIAAAAVMGGFTLAIGPLLAVVVVGVGVSLALDALDEKYGITDRVIAGLDEMGDDFNAYIERRKRGIQDAATRAAGSVIDYVIESATKVAVNLVKDYLRRFLSPIPRLH